MIERDREREGEGIRCYGWGIKKGDGTKKTLSKTGPGSLRISGLCAHANEKTFQLSMFFLRRVFSRCNKLNVTHIPGARFSITLCFPPVSTVRRLLSTPRERARAGMPGRLHFYPVLYTLSSSLEKKKCFFHQHSRNFASWRLDRDGYSVGDAAILFLLCAENIFTERSRILAKLLFMNFFILYFKSILFYR